MRLGLIGVLAMKKILIGTVAALCMLAGAASPAAARPYWGGGYGHYHGYHGGGDAFGNFLLGGLLIGGAVAIASSASRDERPVYRSSSVDDVRDAGAEARAVTSICSDAAEGMAHSRITGIDSVGREGDGWRVEGTVEAGRGNRPFSCGTHFGQVDFVRLG
jgi:hypothetical protein